MEDLPPEILVLIMANLPLSTLVNELSLVSKKFYYLVHEEILSRERLSFDLEISPATNLSHLPQLKLNRLKLSGFVDATQAQGVLNQVNHDIHLYFDNCPAVKRLDFLKNGIKGLHFGPEDLVPTKVYEDVASFKGLMSSLTLPRIPQLFVPLILARQGNVTELEIGECSNQVAFMVCKNLKNLATFAFNGEELTFSGVIGLVTRRDKLRSLSIKNPRGLTKYSMKMLSRNMTKLDSLRLYWKGKLLINNPWNFEFCLDREKQKVDNLFLEGQLENLKSLDLSAFYQTVDDKALQALATGHLGGSSVTREHLTRISLAHCFRVSDNGIQWLVGSCHSPKIQELDFSNCDLTGNCFLRKMPNLSSLSLDGCSSLNGLGLQCISTSCQNLKTLSVSQNKHLTDDALEMAFKSGLTCLDEFSVNYTNINGSCFKSFQSFQLKKLALNSNLKITDESGLAEYLHKNHGYLLQLDLAGTGINGSMFNICLLPNLKRLFLDFCPKMSKLNLQGCPKLSYLSIYGFSAELTRNSNRCTVICSSGRENLNEIQVFARKRGIRLTNWEITKKSMIKGVPFMLSQVYLTSLADRGD